MTDLSLHILDIAQNSITADAKNISIEIIESIVKNKLGIYIIDDGKGIDIQYINKVTDPYFTSRKTRKVGLGLPLFKQSAEQAEGKFTIESKPGKGTKVYAEYKLNNIDTPPVGDIAGVISILVSANPKIDFIFLYKLEKETYILDTKKIKESLENIPISNPDVQKFIKEMITENINNLRTNQ